MKNFNARQFKSPLTYTLQPLIEYLVRELSGSTGGITLAHRAHCSLFSIYQDLQQPSHWASIFKLKFVVVLFS